MRKISLFIILSLLGIYVPGLFGQTTQDLDALALVIKMVGKAQSDDAIKQETLIFKKIYTINNLSPEGNFQSLEGKRIYRVFGKRGKSFEELLETTSSGADSSKNNLDFNFLLDAALTRYFFLLSPRQEIIQSKSCYLIHFWPKNNLPYETVQDEVINRISGIFYVDTKTFILRKLKASLNKSFGKSVFFNMERFDLELEMENLKTGIGVIKKIHAITKYSYRSPVNLFFKTKRFQEHIFLYDYNAFK